MDKQEIVRQKRSLHSNVTLKEYGIEERLNPSDEDPQSTLSRGKSGSTDDDSVARQIIKDQRLGYSGNSNKNNRKIKARIVRDEERVVASTWIRTVPGFRTGKPWKIILACIGYAFIINLSVTTQVNESHEITLWISRFFVFIALLSVVDVFTGGTRIARRLPGRNSNNFIVQIVVRVVASFVLFFFWAFVGALVTAILADFL